MNIESYLTTAEAADALGLTAQGVISAIKREKARPGTGIRAEKVGEGRRGQWLIARAEVERYRRERRPRGRPPGEK